MLEQQAVLTVAWDQELADQAALAFVRFGRAAMPVAQADRTRLELDIKMVISMRQVTVAEAKAQLSSLLDVVEGGEPVLITRRGKPIAAMVPRRPVRDLLPQLQALREALPPQPSSGVDVVRAQRDATER